MGGITVRILDFHCSLMGATVEDENGHYNVYINSRYSQDSQRRTLRHELRHIARDDFRSDAALSDVEAG